MRKLNNIIIILFLIPIIIFAQSNEKEEKKITEKSEEITIAEDSIKIVEKNEMQFNKSGLITSEELENIPVRELKDIIEFKNSVIIQDGNVHFRSGRSGEVGYYVNGVSVNNPMNNTIGIHIINDAIDEIQVLPGVYSAENGNANSGIVKLKLKTGGEKLHGSFETRTDGFRDPADGIKKLDTYNYGHNLIVGTLGGPLFSDKIRFFIAGEMNEKKDSQVRFSEGFTFEERVDTNPWSDFSYDTVDIIYPEGFTPKQEDNYYAINGTVMLDLPIKLKLGGMYTNREYVSDSAPMLSLFNERTYGYKTETMMLIGKATKYFNPKTYLELRGSYYKYNSESNDSWFGNDWTKYMDSTAVSDYTSKGIDVDSNWTADQRDSAGIVTYRSRWRAKRDYRIDGIDFERNGYPTNFYSKQKREFFEIAGDFATQYGKHHELKLGGSYKGSTIRYFSISPYAMSVVDPDSAIESVAPVRWFFDGAVDVYGYDIYGKKEINEDTHYGDNGIYSQAPKRPVQVAGYLIDKIEYNDLVINAGIRYDYLDSDDKELIGPTTDYWYGVLADSHWVKKEPIEEFSPRISIAFIKDKNTVLYFKYGKFIQMPDFNKIYFGSREYQYQIIIGGYYYQYPIGYDLDPIKTNSYEIGIKRKLSKYSMIDITGFIKKTSNLITIGEVPDGDFHYSYYKYTNGNYSDIKGLELKHIYRKNRLYTQFNYTFTVGEGNEFRDNILTGMLARNKNINNSFHPLSYNQKHVGSIIFDYHFGDDDGGYLLQNFGANVLFKFSSGHPFTRAVTCGSCATCYNIGVVYMDDTRSRVIQEDINYSTTPWIYTTDIKIDKSLDIAGFEALFYIVVKNVFNRKNVINVYEATGNTQDDGIISDSDVYGFYTNACGGQDYVDIYNAINITNGQSYWDILNRELYGHPRQIFFGVKVSF